MILETIDPKSQSCKSDLEHLIDEQKRRVSRQLKEGIPYTDDLEADLAESIRREESLSEEELDREIARDALLSCWGEPWPLYADDDLLAGDERKWKEEITTELDALNDDGLFLDAWVRLSV